MNPIGGSLKIKKIKNKYRPVLASKASLRKQQWYEFVVGSCLRPPFSNHIHIYRIKNLLTMNRKLKFQNQKRRKNKKFQKQHSFFFLTNLRNRGKKYHIPLGSITTMLMNTFHPFNINFRQHSRSGRS